MLIRVVIKNFYSIGEELEFNLLPAPYKKNHPGHIYQDKKLRLLKASAIYGANGAGKSNFLMAVKYLKDIVLGEEEIPDNTYKYENRLISQFSTSPVHLEIEFAYLGHYLAYELEFNNGAIIKEALYELGFDQDDILVFERTIEAGSGKIKIEAGKKFFTSAKEKLLLSVMRENLLNHKTPVLRLAEVLKNDVVSAAKAWFEDGVEVIFPKTKFAYLVSALTDTAFNGFANEVLKSYDTGIKSLDVKTIPLDQAGLPGKMVDAVRSRLDETPDARIIVDDDGSTAMRSEGSDVVLKPQTHHTDDSGNDVQFDLPDESDGSQRLIQYIPVLRSLFSEEKSIFIDEIESSIHPSLLKALVSRLLGEGEKMKGQLVFTTHECNLLDMDILRPDEIWFVEKNASNTTMYPLTDFNVRQDLDIEKGYLQGRFGAIPFIGNLRDLKWR